MSFGTAGPNRRRRRAQCRPQLPSSARWAPKRFGSSKPLAIETLELAPPGPGEVLVRIKAAGLCHSDLSVINGDRPRPADGARARSSRRGRGPGPAAARRAAPTSRSATMSSSSSCPRAGTANQCTVGRPALCEPRGRRERRRHASVGCSAAQPLRRLAGEPPPWRLSVRGLRYCLLALAGQGRSGPAARRGGAVRCAVLTGVGAVFNTARTPAGSSVAVVGLGGVGLATLLGAIAAGARQVVAIDLSDEKLRFAEERRNRHLQCAGPRRRHAGQGSDRRRRRVRL